MQLKEKVRGWIRRPTDYVAGEWGRMAPRERRLVAALSGVVALVAVLVTGFLIYDSLQEIAESNDETREALAVIAKNGEVYRDAKQKMMAQEMRIGTEPPQLLADVETAAREAGVQISETNPLPAQAANKRYMEHVVGLTLRQVDLKSLSNFLSKLETHRRLMIVQQLQIRRRMSETEKLDVTMRVITYERVKEDRMKKKGPTPAKKT